MLEPGTIRTKLRALGIDRFVLQIQDLSFPSDPDEDWGRGSPYTRGAERFLAFAARLGFDAIQLGPLGLTGRGQASPYDGTLFSRNPLNLPWGRLAEEGRISRPTLARLRIPAGAAPPSHAELFDRAAAAQQEVVERADAADRQAARLYLERHAGWIVPDALYGLLGKLHNRPWWREWGAAPGGEFDQRLFAPLPGEEAAAAARLDALRSTYAREIEDYALIQMLLEWEHQAFRARAAARGLALYADLQVGLSAQDQWARQALFLPGYLMGAPPSRTNPEGQPWGYAVLDPAQPEARLQFVRDRLRKVLAECDGVRIDHPHGWIDPWVYRSDDPDPFHAVQSGARLFSSPAEPDHPQLQRFAIARADQIEPAEPRYGDRRVRALDGEQTAAYSQLVDLILAEMHALRRGPADVVCEVLSTLPYPVQRVLERHGLGRFRVVQKARLDDPHDVYRIENALPQDWIMLGTHDTPSIWELAARWCAHEPERAAWSAYLSGLRSGGGAGTAAGPAADLATPGELVHAIMSAVFASRARHVMLFFPDLLGMTERYNRPGVVSDENWRLRVPSDFEERYLAAAQCGKALDLERCLAGAMSFGSSN